MRFLSNYHYISNVSLDLHSSGGRESYATDHAVLSHEALDALPGPRDIVKFKDKHWHKGK